MINDAGKIIAKSKSPREMMARPEYQEFMRRYRDRFTKAMDDEAFAYLMSKKP